MMAEGVTVANAFVQIMPSMEGATDNITQAILPGMSTAGTQAGAAFGGMFTGKMGALLKGAGAAALGYLAFDVLRDSFVEVQGGFNNVILATGATGEAAEHLKDVYLDVAGSVVGSFDDIGSAVGELNTRLGLQGEELEKASEQAMKFAKVNGIDATKGIQDVTRMMNNAGIEAEDYAHVLDVLTVAAQQSGIDVGKLAETVTENGASFRELGFSTDEAIAMLAQFEKAGVNSSQVLAGMKKGVAEWAKENKSASEGFAEFVQGVQDGSVTSADAIELFGSRAGIAMYDAAATGQLSWDEMFATISQGSEGALDEVYSNTLTAQEKFDVLGKKVQTGFFEIVEPIVDAIEPYMDDIIAAVSEAVDWIVNVAGPIVSQRVQEFITAAQWMADTFGPVVENIIGFVQDMIDKFTEFKTFVEETFGSISDTVTGDLEDMSTIGSETVAAFTAAMNGDFDSAAEHARNAFDTMKSMVQNRIEAIKTFVSNAVNQIKQWLGFSGLPSNVQGVFEQVRQAVVNPIQNAANTISGIPARIVGFFSGLGSRITSAIGSIRFPQPHVSWESVSIAGVTSVSLPRVSWYKLGGFVDESTIFGAGEAGPEMILPRSGGLMDEFSEAVAADIDTQSVVDEIRAFRQEIGPIIARYTPGVTVREMGGMLNRDINRNMAGGIAWA